jgi:hypothetical protein
VGGLSNGANGNIIAPSVAALNLGTLANNGGPTQTIALLANSPAINAGDNSLAVDGAGNPLSTDQRGPGFARIVGGTVDIGAFEVQQAPSDFSISSPLSLTVQAGSSGAATITTAVTAGAAETVKLSATGLPAGVTASFDPGSVLAGRSSTLTLTAANAVAGSYTVTITGTAGSRSHSTTVTLTVAPPPPPSGISNGGFETGTLAGWTASGTTSVVSSGAHGGTYAARLGSTAPTNGDSSISQTFTAPASSTILSFWYKVFGADTIQYDWATATLRDNTAGTTTTVLAKTETDDGTWHQATAALTAGHSYTLTLTNHDDNYVGDPTHTLFDDVSLMSQSKAAAMPTVSDTLPSGAGGSSAGLGTWGVGQLELAAVAVVLARRAGP